MRITSISGAGLLSFDTFQMDLPKRVTFIVGPNGSGKSNLSRLITLVQRAVESGDGGGGDVERQLASFLAARHIGARSSAIEVRMAVQLTDKIERELIVEFVKALVTSAITGRRAIRNMSEIDAWAESEVTEEKLTPLMHGEIVVSHPGTQDGWWQCAYEFAAPSKDAGERTYLWILQGVQSHQLFDGDAPDTDQGADLPSRIMGGPTAPPTPAVLVPGPFELTQLLPASGEYTSGFSFELTGTPSSAQRRFAEMTGRALNGPAGARVVSLASVLRTIFRRALTYTSDRRLLPSGGVSWSSTDLTLSAGAEGRLPEMLLGLKNGDPGERARYRQIQALFTEFTHGRRVEVRLIEIQQPTQDGRGSEPAHVPSAWVSVNAPEPEQELAPEVLIEFAGAGAWEALVLACILGEPSASVAVLDEPAVALHPTLQRQLGTHLLGAEAQIIVITHSAELLPLAESADVQLVRFDRDAHNATKAFPVEEACRAKMARKLAAKGNERLPFAWRAILCEGQDDVAAIMELAGRMGIDLRRRNIAVADCGSRDNLPDYVWFCKQLGLKYLAVMDADSTTQDALPNAQAARDAVLLHQGGEMAEFPISLEKTFGVVKKKPSFVPQAIRSLPFTGDMPDPTQVPPEVTDLAQAIRRLTT